MDTNKYYTPNINAFHNGFEYEHQKKGESEWCKDIFYLNNSHIEIIRFVSLTDGNNDYNVRVKYLDKEDIESLGFKLTNEEDIKSSYSNNNVNIHFYNKHENIVYNIMINDKNKNNFVKVFIKNLSELKRILTQLRIEV